MNHFKLVYEGILAPLWKLPPDARQPLRRFWTQEKFFEALGSQIGSISTSAAETLDAAVDGYGNLPLVTLSSTDPGDYRCANRKRWPASPAWSPHCCPEQQPLIHSMSRAGSQSSVTC
jgi:hypothetical protein